MQGPFALRQIKGNIVKNLGLCFLLTMLLSATVGYGADRTFTSSNCRTDKWNVSIYHDQVDVPSLLTAFALVRTYGFRVETYGFDPTALPATTETNWIEEIKSLRKSGLGEKISFFSIAFDRSLFKNPKDPIVQSIRDEVISSIKSLTGIEVHCVEPEVGVTISN